MNKVFWGLALLASCIAPSANAQEYRVTVGGTILRDPSGPTLYGSPDNSLPFSIAFSFNAADIQFHPAGSIVGNGYYVTDESFSLAKSQITDLTVALPSNTYDVTGYTSASLQPQTQGQLGSYGVLFQGTLGAISALNFTLYKQQVGELIVGSFECPELACSIAELGYTFSYLDGGFGQIENGTLSYSVQAITAVPEPETWTLTILGLGVTGAAIRRQRSAALRLA